MSSPRPPAFGGARRALCHVLVPGLIACGTADPANVTEQALDDGGTVCSSRIVGHLPDGTPLQDWELYYFAEMRGRLERYPELAAATGLSAVESCADARTFVQGYRAFKESHPEFDGSAIDDAYVALLDQPPDVAEDDVEEDEEVSKIYQGVGVIAPDIKLSVVDIEFADRRHCSGVFISDSWLLSAARCVKKPSAGKVSRSVKVKLWRLDSRGTPVLVAGRRISTVWFPYDKWFGSENHENDLALVSIDTAFLDALYEARDGALPLAAGPLSTSTSLEPWGWGHYDETTLLPEVLLGPPLDAAGARTGLTLGSNEIEPEYLHASVGPGRPRICLGDQGGPLLQNAGPGKNVLRGIASDYDGDLCASDGGKQYFTRVDTPDKRHWIESVLQVNEWFKNFAFACKPVPPSGSMPSNVECWAEYCDGTCDYGYSCQYVRGLNMARRCVEWE